MQKLDWRRPQRGHFLAYLDGKMVGVISDVCDPHHPDPRYRKPSWLMSYVDEIGGSWTETHPTLKQAIRALRQHLFGAQP